MRNILLTALLVVLCSHGLTNAENIKIGASGDAITVAVEEYSTSHTVLKFEVNEFDRQNLDINGESFYRVTTGKEGNLLIAGEPALPRLCRSIIIPDNAHMNLKVLSAEYIDYPDMPVAPSKGNLLRTVNPDDVPYTFGAVYQGQDWYPSELAALREPYILRDYRGTVVEVNAFQYNPATKTLRVYTSVTLEVYADGEAEINALDRSRLSGGLVPEFDHLYRNRFVNYAEVASSLKYTPLGETGDMLIITHDAFHTAMQPLVDWKLQKGIKTTIVDVSTIGNTTTAIDNFIQDFYDSTSLAWIILVGDYTEVVTPQASGGASDPSYAKLAGTDNYPDAFIGRFSATTEAHVQTQVERTIDYERNIVSGNWLAKAMGIASDDSGTGQGGEHDWEHQDLIRADLLGYTYTEVDQMYANLGATDAQVSANLNTGRGLINYTGHGSTTAWSTTGFNNADVDALTNTDMLPWIISVACVNGEFDGPTCFAEAWLRATSGGAPSGAIGAYMSSINQSWSPPMDAQDEIADLLIADAKTTYGGLCFNGSCKMIDINGSGGVEMYDTWHIFGDPSLQVRSDLATTLSVSHEAALLLTATEVPVTVDGFENALCALYHNGILYGSAYTDAAGEAVIPVLTSLPVGEEITLTVTGYNAETLIETIPVIAPSGPYCVYDLHTISDALGNNNGLVEPGEDITLGVQ
ncbi:MAG: hypothetical protein KKA42_09585, partial [candidate division Zixibacteria bacterium]|nr:hypothetical protein [candidate division Zixibacteria bacterium]